MHASLKTLLLAGAALAAVPSLAVAQSAPATEPAASNVQEVTVTARRRAEALKDVPIAVTSVSGEQLERTGAADITKLQQTTPNMTLQVARGSNSTLIAFIRGVGQQDPLWGFEPGVGLYFDDVYVARPQGAVLDIFDVQRIEVLRGPQGTLYGRNTIGGAVKYVTKKIGGDPSLRVRGNLGSYSQADLIVSGATPLTDTFSVSGAVAKYSRDGYGKNLNTGAEHYNKDMIAGRFSAEYAPTDQLFFRLSYDKTVDDSNARHGHREIPVASTSTARSDRPTDSVYDTWAGLGDKNEVRTEGGSLLAEYKLNDQFTLKSITAGRKGDTRTLIDFDNTPAKLLDVPAYYEDAQVSQELQLLFTGDKVSGVGGLFYMSSYAEGAFDTQAGNLGLNIVSAGKVNTRSYSAFADFSFEINDILSVSLGGRYTKDAKDAVVFRAFYLGTANSPYNGGTARAPLQIRTNYQAEKSFSKFTPRVSASLKLSPEMTAYASYSQGFKSGGWDMRGDAVATPDTVRGYKPETVDAYEVGLKGTAFDNRLSFSSAIFRSEYKDQQVTTQVPSGNTIASFVDNVGSSKIWGAEFEGNLSIAEPLSAQFALGYTKGEYEDFQRYNIALGRYENIASQVVFQNTPKWTGYLGLTYRRDFMGGKLTFTPSTSYRSKMSLFEFENIQLDQGEFWLYDASLVWTSEGGRYTLGLHGKNLSDHEYRVGGYNFPGATFGNSVAGFYGPPRTVTATFDVKF
ncbi:MAG: TonB-dependent receptor [Asticcacaulis sp.]